jgi:hypothetical protein
MIRNLQTYHPKDRKSSPNKYLAIFLRWSHIEHYIANYIVIESKCCLLWEFGYESNQVAKDFEHQFLFLPRKSLQDITQEECAIFYQTIPNYLCYK